MKRITIWKRDGGHARERSLAAIAAADFEATRRFNKRRPNANLRRARRDYFAKILKAAGAEAEDEAGRRHAQTVGRTGRDLRDDDDEIGRHPALDGIAASVAHAANGAVSHSEATRWLLHTASGRRDRNRLSQSKRRRPAHRR